MDYNLKKIGQIIKKTRKEKDMTQAELAEALGIGRARVIKIENGEDTQLNISHLIKMSELFGCDIGYLIDEYSTKIAVDDELCEWTGLSEKAIKTLRKENTGLIPVDNRFSPDYGAIIDYILCNQWGKQFLHHLSSYIFDEVTIRYKDKELEENLKLYHKGKRIDYQLNTLDIKSVLLSMIQNDIINMKKGE